MWIQAGLSHDIDMSTEQVLKVQNQARRNQELTDGPVVTKVDITGVGLLAAGN
jgi:hypothetical protein